MSDSSTIRKTYKYRLYTHERNRRLHDQINIAGIIWNHALALQRRYYKLTGKYIGRYDLLKHLRKLRRRRYSFWQLVDSQSIGNLVDRQDKAYQRFFAWTKTRQGRRTSPPRFKKVKHYKSFTLEQHSWQLLSGNKIKLRGRVYKFVNHRPMPDSATIKTVTVKRDRTGKLWLCFSVIEEVQVQRRVSVGQTGGFDFGLKTFLTSDDGRAWASPGFLRPELKTLRKMSKAHSRKAKGSHNREAARLDLARFYAHVTNKRRDFHFKIAHQLCDEYEVLCFETLNLDGMKRLWGRKVSDLGFGQFIEIVQHVAKQRGVDVRFVNRWEQTSQVCSECGHQQSIELRQRTFVCEACGVVLDRDHNAARNIRRVGASTRDVVAVRPASAGGHA